MSTKVTKQSRFHRQSNSNFKKRTNRRKQFFITSIWKSRTSWTKNGNSDLELKLSRKEKKVNFPSSFEAFNRPNPKEGCNWVHGLSAAIKLGSLEKTVGTCLLRSGVYYEQSLSCRKNCTTQPFAFVGDSPFFYKKKTSIFLWCQIDF